MNNNAWFRKEKPLLSLHSMGGGASGTLMQGAADKTYVDDVFSTYLYAETGTTVTVNNGVDMSEGGMVWFKNREATDSHALIDTARGGTKVIHSDTTAVESTQAGAITSFNTNGFEIGNYGAINGGSNKDVTSWSFRKAKGFFDVVKYSGTGSATTISHSLGCVPGLIIIKAIDGTIGWRVYHKATGASYALELQHDTGGYTSDIWNDTAPTATEFSLKTDNSVNSSTNEYVAYLFAGGESTADTARSVDFDGVGDALVSNTSTDYVIGTNDFTLEFWIKFKDNFVGNQVVLDQNKSSNNATTPFQIYGASQSIRFYVTGDHITKNISSQSWNHVAVVRSSGTTTMYINGTSAGTYSDSNNYDSNQLTMGASGGNTATQNMSAFMSNVRLVVGTAVYTSSFKPPTEPLTNITNTKFLACQNSTTTGTTVGSIQAADGNPTASTDSPFDDPAGFAFGDSRDQNVVKCGSYEGNNADDGTEVFVGFEPSLLLIKSVDTTDDWCIFDNLRGMTADGVNDQALFANRNYAEAAGGYLTPTSTGFKLTTQSDRVNNDTTYIYMAIRRPDGYVGKPAEAGTEVFAMDVGNGSSTIPCFDSGFPIDLAFTKTPAATGNWPTYARLVQGNEIILNGTNASGSDDAAGAFDSNAGFGRNANGTDEQAWMFKRGQGMDVVCYKGNNIARHIPHSLSKTPEMMWFKNRSAAREWAVYHKGLNGGTTPQNYHLHLEQTTAEVARLSQFNNTAPTSTHFTIGTDGDTNDNGDHIIAFLFTSVTGISKCGYYSGSGSSGNAQNIGFSPRFLIIKRTNGIDPWMVFDTLRGINNSGDDKLLYLNSNDSQGTIGDHDWISISSTGFSLSDGNGATNTSGGSYIYYAHA